MVKAGYMTIIGEKGAGKCSPWLRSHFPAATEHVEGWSTHFDRELSVYATEHLAIDLKGT